VTATAQKLAISPTDSAIRPPLFSRLLAAFIDYLVLMALTLLLSGITVDPDLQTLCLVIASASYFTIAGSWVLHGQTIGKRIFSLQTQRLNAKDGNKLLSLPASFLRYLFTYGLVLSLAEGIPMLFRRAAFTAAPWLMEVHMYFALLLTVGSLLFFIFTAARRSIADLLLNTVVSSIAGDSNSENLTNSQINPSRSRTLALTIGTFLLAFLLWLPAILMPSGVKEFMQNRYILEHQFPLRVISVGAFEQKLILELMLTQPQAEPEELIKSIVKTIDIQSALLRADFKSMEFNLDLPQQNQANAFTRKAFSVDLQTLVITQVNSAQI